MMKINVDVVIILIVRSWRCTFTVPIGNLIGAGNDFPHSRNKVFQAAIIFISSKSDVVIYIPWQLVTCREIGNKTLHILFVAALFSQHSRVLPVISSINTEGGLSVGSILQQVWHNRQASH